MRRAWTAVTVVGLALLIGAAALAFWNFRQDAEAGSESEAIVYELAGVIPDVPAVPEEIQEVEQAADPEGYEMPSVTIDGTKYMGVIYFPDLNRELPVFSEYALSKLKTAPAVYYGSPITHDLVICAHNYRSHFGPINRLPVGASVQIKCADGTVFDYRIAATEVGSPFAVEDVTSGAWDLTLFTCTLGGRTRYVVRCDMI